MSNEKWAGEPMRVHIKGIPHFLAFVDISMFVIIICVSTYVNDYIRSGLRGSNSAEEELNKKKGSIIKR